MPAQLRRATVAAALLLGACGGGDTIPSEAASRIVLQPGDLGAAYQRFDEGRQQRADVSEPREDPHRFGRTAGWKARFRARAADTRNRVAVVESMADLFGDEGGARRDLDAYRQSVSMQSRRELPVSGLGDEAIARSQEQGDVRFFTLAWRTANATASLTVSGFGIGLEHALALARKQQARLDRAAG